MGRHCRFCCLVLLLGGIAGAQSVFAEDAVDPAEPQPSRSALSDSKLTEPSRKQKRDGASGSAATSPPVQTSEHGDAAAHPKGRQLALFRVVTRGVDGRVSELLGKILATEAQRLGYTLIAERETQAALREAPLVWYAPPKDVFRATWAAKAGRGVVLFVSPSESRYLGHMTVASLDGRGPYTGVATGTSKNFALRVLEVFRQLLPSPDLWDEKEAKSVRAAATSHADERKTTREVDNGTSRGDMIFPNETAEAAWRASERRRRYRMSVAAVTESIFGAARPPYYNHVAGARFDVRLTETLSVGGFVGYINARGRNGRSHNVLSYANFEHRFYFKPESDVSIPLRVGAGYLPYNGPMVRTSLGLNVPLSDRVELGTDLLAPTVWILPRSTTVSFNFSLEALVRF